MTTKSIIVPDGTKIVYDEYGSMTHATIFLLHGNGSSARYFKPQIEQYARYFHVSALDSRGHGRSSNTKNKIEIMAIVSDIEFMRKTFNLSQFIILGYSDGANIAIKYATVYPNRVYRMVLNAPNLSKKGIYKILWWLDSFAQHLTRVLAPISHYAARRHKQLHVMSEPLNISRGDLQRVAGDVLLVIGSFDLVKRRHIERIRQLLPHAEMMVIPRHSHFITYTNPKKFSRLVMPFLLGGIKHAKN